MCLCVYMQSLNEYTTRVMNSEYSLVFFFLEKCSVYDKETVSESLLHTHTFLLFFFFYPFGAEILFEMSSLHPVRLHAASSSSTKGNVLMVADASDRLTLSCCSELECKGELWGLGPSLAETGF